MLLEAFPLRLCCSSRGSIIGKSYVWVIEGRKAHAPPTDKTTQDRPGQVFHNITTVVQIFSFTIDTEACRPPPLPPPSPVPCPPSPILSSTRCFTVHMEAWLSHPSPKLCPPSCPRLASRHPPFRTVPPSSHPVLDTCYVASRRRSPTFCATATTLCPGLRRRATLWSRSRSPTLRRG